MPMKRVKLMKHINGRILVCYTFCLTILMSTFWTIGFQYTKISEEMIKSGLKDIETTILHIQDDVNRLKRSTDNHDEIKMHFRYAGENYRMSVSKGNSILHPSAVIGLIHRNVTIPWLGKHPNCFLSGNVTSHHQGRVSLSTCNGLIGVVSLQKYSLHVREHNAETATNKISLLVGRERSTIERLESYDDFFEKFSRRKTKRSVIPKNLTIELAIYADSEYTKTIHKRDMLRRVEHMILKYSAVQMEFSRADLLGHQVFLSIKKMAFYEVDPDWYKTSDCCLERFCRGTRNEERYDIRYSHTGGRGMSTLGVAYVKTGCSQDWCCGIDADTNPTGYQATTHEIGHILGMKHDADVGCNGTNVGMMGGYGAGWSTCSRDKFHEFLRDTGSCLWEEDVDRTWMKTNFNIESGIPGQLYSPDEICELTYGSGYRYRELNPYSGCSEYVCADHNVGNTYGQMSSIKGSINGKYCAEDKICFGGCVDPIVAKQTSLRRRKGGWGSWGQWSGCSRKCGRGVNFRHRKCDNPSPIDFNGCEGDGYEAEACNIKACSIDSDNQETLKIERASETCSFLLENGIINSTVYTSNGTKRSSRGYEQCEVKCLISPSFGNAGYSDRSGFMPHGTPCSGELDDLDERDWPRKPGYYFMCIDGLCEKFGCDNKFHGSKFDECGVCGGDNSSCNYFSVNDVKQQEIGERRILVRLPLGSYNIQFVYDYRESPYVEHFIELFSKSDEPILSSWLNWIWNGHSLTFAGTKWMYHDGSQYLYAKGPLTEPCVIKVYKRGNTTNSGIHYQYSEPKPTTFECDFRTGVSGCGWSNEKWLDASKTTQSTFFNNSENYIYITNNSVAVLTSSTVKGSSLMQCLLFSYLMNGAYDSSLSVRWKSDSSTDLWRENGTQYGTWRCGAVNLSTLENDQITFVGMTGPLMNGSTRSTLALSKITLSENTGSFCNSNGCRMAISSENSGVSTGVIVFLTLIIGIWATAVVSLLYKYKQRRRGIQADRQSLHESDLKQQQFDMSSDKTTKRRRSLKTFCKETVSSISARIRET